MIVLLDTKKTEAILRGGMVDSGSIRLVFICHLNARHSISVRGFEHQKKATSAWQMGLEWDKVRFRAQTEVKHGRVSSKQADYCMYYTAGISWAKLRWARLIWIERLDFAERRDFSINLCSYRGSRNAGV
jgi:hypothetical protein